MSYDPYLDGLEIEKARQKGGVKVVPTPDQKKWLELGFGMFIHFGINTFHDKEWSDGTLDLSKFNPGEFDPESWCEAAKKAGIKYLLLVTKHHDGFCNWPSEWTDYSVKNTPFGKDVVGLVAEAAAKSDLKLGFYYSLWDRNFAGYEHDHGYALYMKRQLAELLTRYGEIVEIWFDGGWKKGGVHYQDASRWFWREIYEHIKTIQPGCMVGNNGTSSRPGEIITWPCDFRIGEKVLPPEDDRKIWYCGGIGDWLPYESCYTLSGGGKKEGMFADGKWFWHVDDQSVRPAEQIAAEIKTCNARGGNYILNAGPDNRGKLRDIDQQCLEQIGRILKSSN